MATSSCLKQNFLKQVQKFAVRGIQTVTYLRKYETLEEYGSDLTELAKQGKLDPVIGREGEIRRCIEILSRMKKNNPIITGAPGVGKTTLAHGLAQRIVRGDVPDPLMNRKLISLDMSSAGGTGDFDDTLKAVLNEVKASDGQIILFIDDIHTFFGVGVTRGAMDREKLLNSILGSGELRCIGAITMTEYRKDPALEYIFQEVYCRELSLRDTISILRGLRKRFELQHGVNLLDNVLVSATVLADRCIRGRYLPGKAIDVVHKLALKLKRFSKLNEIDTSKLNDLMNGIRQKKEEIDVVNLEMEAAEPKNDLNRAAELKHELQRQLVHLESLQHKSVELVNKMDEMLGNLGEMHELVTHAMMIEILFELATDVKFTKMVSKWTGMPLSNLQRWK